MERERWLEGRSVVAIGGSSGFGERVAHLAAAAGAELVVVGRDGRKARDVAEELSRSGRPARGCGLDATDEAQLEGLFDRVGPFDHLISTVGGAMGGGFLSADPAEIRRTIEGKFFASLAIARSAAPHVRDGGSLTFTAGSGGRPDTASGAIVGNQAIATLVRGLALELAPRVRANAVAPTWTPTPLWRGLSPADLRRTRDQMAAQIPLGRTGTIDEVARAFLFLMRDDFVTGQTITVDGGLSLAP